MKLSFKPSVLLLGLLVLIIPKASSAQLMLVSPENAERAAAYINSQKQVILFCGCCGHDRPLKVSVAEASVEQYQNLGTGVRLKGVDQNNHSINKFIDLAYVWVKAKKSALSLGKVMNLNCNPCASQLNWKTMLPEKAEEHPYYKNEKVQSSLAVLLQQLNNLPTFSIHTNQKKKYEVVKTTAEIDKIAHTLHYSIVHSGAKTLHYAIPLARIRKIKRKKDLVIIIPEKGSGLWIQETNNKDNKQKSVEVEQLVLNMPDKDISKQVKKQLQILIQKNKALK